MAVDLRQTFFGDAPLEQQGLTQAPLNNLLSSILPNIFVFSGLLLFLYLVFGGFKIIAGAGDAKSTEEGQQALTNAIIGFVIIFAAYWIIQIVQVITGIPILYSNL